MIHFHGVHKRFGRLAVLTGFDAKLSGGRITALVGPNGAGKTTLIKLLLDLARPDQGRITIDGVSPQERSDCRMTIGYMSQIAHFPPHLSGRDLLGVLTRLRGGATPDLSLAEAFDLGEAFDRPFGTLSGGTRQKVNAVLALAFRPKLLLLDEPTAGLDPVAARVLKDRLHAERRRGTTILITSHILPELEELADEVLFLSQGVAAWSGELTALRARTGEPTLERALVQLLGGGIRRAVA